MFGTSLSLWHVQLSREDQKESSLGNLDSAESSPKKSLSPYVLIPSSAGILAQPFSLTRVSSRSPSWEEVSQRKHESLLICQVF